MKSVDLFLLVFVVVTLAQDANGCDGKILNNATFGTLYNCTVSGQDSIRFVYHYNISDLTMVIMQQSSETISVFHSFVKFNLMMMATICPKQKFSSWLFLGGCFSLLSSQAIIG